MKKKIALALCAAMLATSCLAGCGSGGQQANVGGNGTSADMESGAVTVVGGDSDEISEKTTDADTFVLGASEEPTTLEPAEAQLVSGWICTGAVYDNLVTLNEETGEIEGVLAESWEYTDDTTLVIRIKEGIKFHDGSDLTADDVLFTLERLAASSRYATNYSCIDFDNCTVEDDTTLTVKLSTTYAPLLSYLCHPSAGVLSRAYYEEAGEEGLAREPMGTGAFVFDSWVSGDRFTAHRNDDYWGDKPSYENLVVRFITESTTRMIEFETGGVDAVIDLASSDIERMENQEVSGSVLYKMAGEKITRLEMYEGYEPFQDERVREAICHAIDFESVVTAAYGSTAEYTSSVLPKDCMYYVETEGYEYNPELSKKLLEEAGYGGGFTVSASVGSGSSDAKALEIIQAQLSDVGIEMELELTDVSTSLDKMLNGQANIGVINGTVNVKDPDQALSNIKAESPFKISSSSDETLNEYLTTGAVSVDDSVRAEAYENACNYLHDHYLSVPICVSVVTYGVRDYVDYFPASASGWIDVKTITFK